MLLVLRHNQAKQIICFISILIFSGLCIALSTFYLTKSRVLTIPTQFKSHKKINVLKTKICVLIAIKESLLHHAILSVEKTRDPLYDYIIFFGYDDDEIDLASELALFMTNVSVDYKIVKVHNLLQKPGPVFNALSTYSVENGCDYLYRINDDTELIGNDWSSKYINTLTGYDPPNVGVVGPTCYEGNTNILTHDFVHKTHLDIFNTHYPVELTDWWLDDWISSVYGNERTRKLSDVVVKHHLYGSRYTVTFSNQALLQNLVNLGRDKIDQYIEHNVQNDSTIHIKKLEIPVNTIIKGGQISNINDFRSPLFITFINEGFKTLTANFICNLQAVMPDVLEHHLIIIVDSIFTAKWLMGYDKQLSVYVYVSDENVTQTSASYGTDEYKSIMMHRGYGLLHFLGRGKRVVWLEPDAIYYDNLLKVQEIVAPKSDYVFFDDYNMPCGCFIVFPGDSDGKVFYEKVLSYALQNHDRNDQISLNTLKHEVTWSLLDKCKFRSGIYIVDTLPSGNKRLTDCDNATIIVQHLNFIIGLDAKIGLAKRLGAWYIDESLRCMLNKI